MVEQVTACQVPQPTCSWISDIQIRTVELESLKVGKSLKNGKSRIKSEKSDLIFYKTFGKNAKMP